VVHFETLLLVGFEGSLGPNLSWKEALMRKRTILVLGLLPIHAMDPVLAGIPASIGSIEYCSDGAVFECTSVFWSVGNFSLWIEKQQEGVCNGLGSNGLVVVLLGFGWMVLVGDVCGVAIGPKRPGYDEGFWDGRYLVDLASTICLF